MAHMQGCNVLVHGRICSRKQYACRRENLGFPKTRGAFFGDSYNQDYSILGSILRSPYFGKQPLQDARLSGPVRLNSTLCKYLPSRLSLFSGARSLVTQRGQT